MSHSASTPFEILHHSLADALHVRIGNISYQYKNWYESKKQGVDVYEQKTRPAYIGDVSIDMFEQTWSDTSLGFGGVAGQAFTSAYTVVLFCAETQHYYVYHGGRHAYTVNVLLQSEKGRKAFGDDLAGRCLVGCTNQAKYR
jgi:hypothetical protein